MIHGERRNSRSTLLVLEKALRRVLRRRKLHQMHMAHMGVLNELELKTQHIS